MKYLFTLWFAFVLALSACAPAETPHTEVPRTGIDTTRALLSPETHQLSSPFQMEVLPDGRLAVLDPELFQVRFYHPDGSIDFHVGRQGKGPGEFVAARGLDVSGRYVNVYDLSTMLVSQFDHNGTFVRNYVAERESSFFGFLAMGPGQSYYVNANGRDGALLRYRNAATDSTYAFGEPLADDPPPASARQQYQEAAAGGRVPEAIKNDLIMEYDGGHLYVCFRNVPLLRRYTGRELDWEREIDLPVNEAIFEEFVQAFQGSESAGYRALRYVGGIAVTGEGVYLLWNAGGEHPQQVIRVSHEGNMQRIYELRPGSGKRFDALEVDEDRGRVYLLNARGAEVRYFRTGTGEES